MNPSLNEQYEKQVRPCIDLIDSLRALGVEKDIALPAITVIGDQSSGKSSVLEVLSGVRLPRGTGLVTRCPLELRMKSGMRNDWHGKIKYMDYEYEINHPEDVERLIRRAQNEISGAVNLSDEIISLEVTSANVPDLTLIDLPGIVRVPFRGQPENIGEQSKALIQKFIKRPNTIILVVVPCNVDIATTEALKMTKEVDPEGKRTLGILTKPDLIDVGTEETVLSIMNNTKIYLRKGYMIVRCRGQRELDDQISLLEAIETEQDFFRNHSHFRPLYDSGKATISKLAEKLTGELVCHIKQSLPELEQKILKKLAEAQAEMDQYGEPPTEPGQRILFLTDKITAFTQDAINLTSGEALRTMPHVNIFSKLRKQFTLWKTHLDKSTTTFNNRIMEELGRYDERYRGRQLPFFISYNAFEVILTEQIQEMEQPSTEQLKEVSDFIQDKFISLAKSNFEAFPHLLKMTMDKIDNICTEKKSEAETMLRTQFKMELTIYTQDTRYTSTLTQQRMMEEEIEINEHGTAYRPTTDFRDQSDKDALMMLKQQLKSYYSIAIERLADQVPLVIKYMMLQESAAQLQREMIQLVSNENTEDLLKEDDHVNSKRNRLKFCLAKLREARQKLSNF